MSAIGSGAAWTLDVGAIPPPIRAAQWFNTPAAKTLQDLKGHVVLIDFWGVWCSPCRKEMPALVQLHKDLSGSGLVILGVHTPQKADLVRDYVSSQGIPFVVAIDTGETATAYGIDTFPAYVLLDKSGVVVSVTDQPPDAGRVRSLLRAHSAGR